jgi:translation initiation factor 1
MGRKPRVPVSDSQSPLVGNPFADLPIEGVSGREPAPVEAREEARPKPGRIVLRREKARRGGKTVIVAGGFEASLSDEEINRLGREARQACGCGGTVRDREIELQGDQPGKARALFESRGFRVDGVR